MDPQQVLHMLLLELSRERPNRTMVECLVGNLHHRLVRRDEPLPKAQTMEADFTFKVESAIGSFGEKVFGKVLEEVR